MRIDIDIICPNCGEKMELENFYAHDSNPTTFSMVPCKCGIDYKKYIKTKKTAAKGQLKRSMLPKISVFGDHLKATR